MKDPLIDEIRAVRHQISEEMGHDSYALVRHYMELQERHKDRMVDFSHRGRKSTEEHGEPLQDDKVA